MTDELANPFTAADFEDYHGNVGRRAKTLRAEVALLDNDQLSDIIDNGDSGDRGLQARLELAARREQAAKATKRAPLDARNTAIVEALHQPGALARTVAPNFAHLDGRRAGEPLGVAHIRRIHAEACGSPCPHTTGQPPAAQSRPKPQRRRALRAVQPDDDPAADDPAPLALDDDGLPLAIPDDRVPLGENDPLPEKPAPPALLGLLYHDRINYIAGDKSTGKTTICTEALAVAVNNYAMRAVWLDAEDSAAVFSERLARLGHRDLTTSVYVRRFAWDDWIDAEPGDRAAVAAWLAAGGNGGHMFIDSGSATGAGDSASDFAGWKLRHLVHPAVTVIEHTAKNPEQRWGPAGSLRKGATATV